MKREEQKERRRQEIINTALDLFIRKGYGSAKTSDISKEAGMSEGLLFHYFPSKEKLLEELIEIGVRGTRMPLEMEFARPIEFFELFTAQLFEYMKQEPYTAKMFVLMSQVGRSEGVPRHIKEKVEAINTIEHTAKVIEAGQAAGQIRKGNAMSLANAFWCSIQGIAEHYAMSPQIPLPDPEWIVDIVKERG